MRFALVLFLLRRMSTPNKVLIIGAVLLLLGAAYAAIREQPRPPAATPVANPYTVWRICDERISAGLKAPSTANFEPYNEQAISRSGDTFTVTSYVDADNGFGAHIRTPYVCHVRWSGTDYSVLDVAT